MGKGEGNYVVEGVCTAYSGSQYPGQRCGCPLDGLASLRVSHGDVKRIGKLAVAKSGTSGHEVACTGIVRAVDPCY